MATVPATGVLVKSSEREEVSIVYLYVCRFVSTGISYRQSRTWHQEQATALFFCVGSRQFCRALLLVLHILLHRTCAPNYERGMCASCAISPWASALFEVKYTYSLTCLQQQQLLLLQLCSL